MSSPELLAPYFARLHASPLLRWQGRITQVVGQLVESQGPFCSVGELCQMVDSTGAVFPGEIVGFKGPTVLSMPLAKPTGLRYGDRVVTWGERPTLRVGEELIGRVIGGSGDPLDGAGACAVRKRPLLCLWSGPRFTSLSVAECGRSTLF